MLNFMPSLKSNSVCNKTENISDPLASTNRADRFSLLKGFHAIKDDSRNQRGLLFHEDLKETPTEE